MLYKRILCMTALVFFLVSTSSAFAVEPTTFPGTEPAKQSNKAVTANPKSAPQVKGTPGKGTKETGVLVKPTAMEKTAPKTRKK